jgi:predicted nuclease of restriction endonuclease-like (RecB) superfamily
MSKPSLPRDYTHLLKEIKDRIAQAQTRAVLSVNAELVRLYWDIGRMIERRQKREGWGAGVIPRLARELRHALPELKGFSERNIDRVIAFYRTYPNPAEFSPQPVAKLPGPEKVPHTVAKLSATRKLPQAAARIKPSEPDQKRDEHFPDSLIWSVPWAHHVVLVEKIKDSTVRLWYMQQTLANGWSRNVLLLMVKSEVHRRQGNALVNFDRLLPAPQSDLVRQALKDPYIFDFLTMEEPFHERELETSLLHHLERFLLELGQGFAFVGRQYRVQVADDDFYIDLLFYHLKLRCFVVIDLKKGEFKPEYAGKMNFYLAVTDDRLRHPSDAPTIGLILCQDRNQIVAEYALRGINRPIGVSEYELTRALPASLRSALPTIEEIEAELSDLPDEPRRVNANALPAPAMPKRASTKRSPKKRKETGRKK